MFIAILLFGAILPTLAQDTLLVDAPSRRIFPVDLDSVKVDSFFRKFSIDLNQTNDPEMYYEVYRWYKTCYQYGGNTGKGIDCSHFVHMLYDKIYGKKLSSSSGSIFTQCKVVKSKIDDAVEGDLVFFRIKKNRISHVALYLQQGKFAHATTHAGVIISSITEPYYKKHFYKVGRLE